MISSKTILFALAVSWGGGLMSQEAVDPPVLVRSFAEVEKAAPPFADGKFAPESGETIAFLGGTNTFDQQRYPILEMRLQAAWPEKELHVRNLGWQGDTVYSQARPQFFYTKEGDKQPGSSPDTREKTAPGIIVLNFGKMESLKGKAGLQAFVKTYGALLDELMGKTERMVLVGPTPFFPVGPAAALTESRNVDLGGYVAAIEKLAGERDLLFVDAYTAMKSSLKPEYSSNGIHLTESGHAVFAGVFAEQLGFPAGGGLDLSKGGTQSLRQAIQRKDRLWQQYYHPTNWAFLYGDRQHVPASRDYIDTNKRWFVKEIDALPPLIAETEADIHRYAGEVTK